MLKFWEQHMAAWIKQSYFVSEYNREDQRLFREFWPVMKLINATLVIIRHCFV